MDLNKYFDQYILSNSDNFMMELQVQYVLLWIITAFIKVLYINIDLIIIIFYFNSTEWVVS